MLRFPALRIQQHNKEIFTFKVLGKNIFNFASIAHINRDCDGNLKGYQRLDITKHVKEIATYLSEKGSILANSIVIGFDTSVKFEALEDNSDMELLFDMLSRKKRPPIITANPLL
jgi:DGQHR domain-containing protein